MSDEFNFRFNYHNILLIYTKWSQSETVWAKNIRLRGFFFIPRIWTLFLYKCYVSIILLGIFFASWPRCVNSVFIIQFCLILIRANDRTAWFEHRAITWYCANAVPNIIKLSFKRCRNTCRHLMNCANWVLKHVINVSLTADRKRYYHPGALASLICWYNFSNQFIFDWISNY